ncbi:Hpt domain-containing protein [Nonlabens antarcticus]|uniref:Hpt domain-containing protein n=1 Tax=Nonlabens antarcticus TaxID=392714 RepID=UPI0018913BBF|nr:Hpt domain-containing protein [Nonlabens antarcticus]
MSKNDILELEQLRESFGDDPDTFIAVLEMFMIEVPNDYDDLQNKMDINDFYASGLLAHKVKSSYRMIGMEEETLLLQEIEDRAKRKEELDEIPALFEKFKAMYPEGLKLIMRTIKHLKKSK